MTILSRTGVFLAAALMLAPAWPVAAQSAQQPPPAQPQTPPVVQTPPVTQTPPTTAQAPPEQTPPPRRPTKRKPRTSKRQPSSSARGSFGEARVSRDPGPTRQEVTVAANMVGGYDDNLTAGLGTGSGVTPTAMASGTTAFVDGTLGYFLGNDLHSVRLDTTGSLRAYPGYIEQPAPGGAVNVNARTTFARGWTLGASEGVRYEPFFSVYTSNPAGGAPLPPSDGPAVAGTGLYEQNSLGSSTAVSLGRESRRDWTSLSYSYDVREVIEVAKGDSTSHAIFAGHRRGLTRNVQASADYRYRTSGVT